MLGIPGMPGTRIFLPFFPFLPFLPPCICCVMARILPIILFISLHCFMRLLTSVGVVPEPRAMRARR